MPLVTDEGSSGDSDPYLLRESSVPSQNQSTVSRISYRQMHRERFTHIDLDVDRDKPLVFLSETHDFHGKYKPPTSNEVLLQIRAELQSICSDEIGIRLVRLHFRYVYPYFPVLSRSQMLLSGRGIEATVQALPLSLKAVLYATGLPFMVYDNVLATTLDLGAPSADDLYRICWLAITHEIHSPDLATLQACLLLLQRSSDDPYVMDSPFRWSLLAWTVSLAQSLGLYTECSIWHGIPAWEKRLRRRLWWATYVMDKWSFMTAGLSSHVKKEDFDVLPLTSSDFISSDMDSLQQHEAIQDGVLLENSHFYHLVQLSEILSDIIDSYYTIRASTTTANNFALTLELAKPLRSRLHSWKESYDVFVSSSQVGPISKIRLDGNASLGLAYPITTMILFRALLRPLGRSEGTPEDKVMREKGRDAVRVGAKACCVEVVQYLESVKPGAFSAFWHSCKTSSELLYSF